jgi:hypothetical protein
LSVVIVLNHIRSLIESQFHWKNWNLTKFTFYWNRECDISHLSLIKNDKLLFSNSILLFLTTNNSILFVCLVCLHFSLQKYFVNWIVILWIMFFSKLTMFDKIISLKSFSKSFQRETTSVTELIETL